MTNQATHPTQGFTHALLGRTGVRVLRLGFSASYRPGEATVRAALDAGVNVFFCYGFDGQMIRVVRALPSSQRSKILIATGAYNLIVGHPSLRRTLEKRLRQLRTDYIDVFLFLGVMKEGQFPAQLMEEMQRLRAEGKARFIGLSVHDRPFAGRLAAAGAPDVLMVRYNAAHRGAEQEVFPHLAAHNPGVISYTATRWTALLRPTRSLPGCPAPDAGLCYRFVLANPHVDVCLTAPRSLKEFRENLAALEAGAPPEDEMQRVRAFGDAVRKDQRWFL